MHGSRELAQLTHYYFFTGRAGGKKERTREGNRQISSFFFSWRKKEDKVPPRAIAVVYSWEGRFGKQRFPTFWQTVEVSKKDLVVLLCVLAANLAVKVKST